MKRIIQHLSALLAAGTLSACTALAPTSVTGSYDSKTSPQTAGALVPISTLLDTEKYFPLQRTFTWTYTVSVATPTGTSSAEDETRINTLGDASGTRLASFQSRRTVGGTLTSLDSGTFTQTASLLTLASSGGSETIQLPFAAGKTWTSGTLTARSFAVERLTLGAKTYHDLIAISYEKNGETKAVRWFASGYGLVKQVSRSTVNGEPVVVTSELKTARLSAVTGVVVSPPSLTLALSTGTGTASARVNYDDSSQDLEVLFDIASKSIATVNDAGVVTPVASGSTVLIVSSRQDPTKSATISVNVN